MRKQDAERLRHIADMLQRVVLSGPLVRAADAMDMAQYAVDLRWLAASAPSEAELLRGKWIGLTQAADEIAGMITAEESTGASRETLLALAHAERSLRAEAEDMLRRLREMETAA